MRLAHGLPRMLATIEEESLVRGFPLKGIARGGMGDPEIAAMLGREIWPRATPTSANTTAKSICNQTKKVHKKANTMTVPVGS